MGPSCDLEMFGDLAVAGDPAVMRSIQPNDLGQQMRITRIRLRPRRGMPFPIPGHLQRVDRKHHTAGRQQRLHPRPTVGFDAQLHLVRLGRRIQMLRYQLMQGRDPGQPSGSRRRASTRPDSSSISMSWWASAQSSPTNSTAPPRLQI
jgi:hypothetical protein